MRSSIWRTNRSLPSSTEFYYYLISFISIHFNTFFFCFESSFYWCDLRFGAPNGRYRVLPSLFFLISVRLFVSLTSEDAGTVQQRKRMERRSRRSGSGLERERRFFLFLFFFWFFSFLFSLFPFGAYWLPWTLLLSRLFRLGSVCSPFPCPSHRFRRWSHDLFVSWFDKKAEKLGKTRSNTVPKGNHSREPDKTLENPVKLGNARSDSINTQCHDNLIKRE